MAFAFLTSVLSPLKATLARLWPQETWRRLWNNRWNKQRNPSGATLRSPHFSSANHPEPPSLVLHSDGTYPCPICGHGTVATMPLMETFGCNFCRHIFSPDFTEQVLKVEDSVQPLRWTWRGKAWRPVRHSDPKLTPLLWLISGAIAIIPPLLIGLSQYLFPPLPGSRLSTMPQTWLALTVVCHGALASWILLEHHQPASYASWKIRWQDWRDRLRSMSAQSP